MRLAVEQSVEPNGALISQPQYSESEIAAPACAAERQVQKAHQRKWRGQRVVAVALTHELERDVRVRNYHARTKVQGPIDAPHLLGPAPLSFERYLRAAEVRDWVISQKSSHAMKMYEEMLVAKGLDGPDGQGADAVLMNMVRRYAAEQPEGYRYWQRVKNVIWKPFIGLLAARLQNLKARRGEEEKLQRRSRRADKEKVRLATRNNSAAARERGQAKANRLRIRAARLRSLAANKERNARAWLAQVEALNKEAEQKQFEAEKIERELTEQKAAQLVDNRQ